jgi:hypothetical protein
MFANSTDHAQAILSASDAVVSQEVADDKISNQSACTLNTRYNLMGNIGLKVVLVYFKILVLSPP